jgi:cytochrome c556
VSLGLLGAVGYAQDEAEFQKWMKDTAATNQKIRKQLQASAHTEVAKDAEHLASIYKNVGAFFAKRGNADDAVKIAADGEKALMELAAAANTGDTAKIQESMKIVGGSCAGCHRAHREQVSPNVYKIK